MALVRRGALCHTVWGWGRDKEAQYAIHEVIGILEKKCLQCGGAFSHLLHHLNLKKKIYKPLDDQVRIRKIK